MSNKVLQNIVGQIDSYCRRHSLEEEIPSKGGKDKAKFLLYRAEIQCSYLPGRNNCEAGMNSQVNINCPAEAISTNVLETCFAVLIDSSPRRAQPAMSKAKCSTSLILPQQNLFSFFTISLRNFDPPKRINKKHFYARQQSSLSLSLSLNLNLNLNLNLMLRYARND